jgi:hypothetical protein
MANQYHLHLPDGTEYRDIDRATLETWHREGRLPAETLVWPEGSPAWLPLDQALAAPDAPVVVESPAAAPAAEPAAAPATATASARPVRAPVPTGDDRPETRPSMRTPVFDGKAPASPAGTSSRTLGEQLAGSRNLVLGLVGIAVVVGALAGLWAVLRPYLAKRHAIAAVQRYALADRRVEDTDAGLLVELPAGWVALREDNPFVSRSGSRLRLAQPAAGAFGAVSVAARPRQMDDLDAHLDELLQERLPRMPSQKEGARSEVQLGRGRGRQVRTTWEDGLVPMQGAIVAWADGYDLFSLEAWAPASTGDAFAADLDALCRGIAPKGQVSARIDEAVERLAVEVPELSRDALRLLVAERMSQGRGLEDVPSAALRMVSRGLDALGAAEAAEMRSIYQQVWAPVPEGERVRLAGLMNEIKAGRPVQGQDVLALRTAVQTGVLALPEEQRARLQELSGRAVRQSFLLP